MGSLIRAAGWVEGSGEGSEGRRWVKDIGCDGAAGPHVGQIPVKLQRVC